MKYLFPIIFAVTAVYLAFAIPKYGPSVAKSTSDLAGRAAKSKPVANLIDLISVR